MYVSKDVLNHYLVHSSTFNDLKSAKNVVFFSFCILVDMPVEGAIALPAHLATLLTSRPFTTLIDTANAITAYLY